MLSPNDLRQKFRIVPGQQSVTLTPKNPPRDAIQVDGARLRQNDNPSELQAAGINVRFDSMTWILPAINLGGSVPAIGDFINDGAQDWVIVGFDKSLQAGPVDIEFKCVCNKAR